MHSTTAQASTRDQKPAADDLGRSAGSPWQMPLSGWKDVAVRTWRESSDDNVGIVAAGVAFYGFLALVPLLGAIVISYGFIAAPSTVVGHAQSLTSILPQQVAQLIGDMLLNVVETSGGKKGLGLILALAIALWGARNAAGSIITALNIAYEEEEKRGFLKVTLIALAMTAGSVLVALLAIGATVVLGLLQSFLPDSGPVALTAWKILTYALLGAAATAAIATLYRYAPDREDAKWTWLTPGSLFASLVWIVLTLGFGFYVSNFGNYDATYGSLGAVVVLLTWMYLSAYVLLFGAELNSELEHQTERDTTPGPERPPGDRGAWAADHVAQGADGQSRQPQPRSDDPGREPGRAPQPARAMSYAEPAKAAQPSSARAYAVSRAASRAGGMAGLRKVGMISSALATAGLALLRRRGREGAGAALLATAAGISLMKRGD